MKKPQGLISTRHIPTRSLESTGIDVLDQILATRFNTVDAKTIEIELGDDFVAIEIEELGDDFVAISKRPTPRYVSLEMLLWGSAGFILMLGCHLFLVNN